ncbi:hypothetical protein CHUAL_000201 [Chamberlinius hualienensis]
MKTLACLLALFLSVNAQLTYQPVENECSTKLTPGGVVSNMIGSWKILTWTREPASCGTFTFEKDDSGESYTGTFSYYKQSDTEFKNKIVEINKYAADPNNAGILDRATEDSSTPFRNMIITSATKNEEFGVIGCDFKEGSTRNYAAGYYGPDADQATKDELKSTLASGSQLTLNDFYQGSDCPSD